jgi:hypothetical protein
MSSFSLANHLRFEVRFSSHPPCWQASYTTAGFDRPLLLTCGSEGSSQLHTIYGALGMLSAVAREMGLDFTVVIGQRSQTFSPGEILQAEMFVAQNWTGSNSAN